LKYFFNLLVLCIVIVACSQKQSNTQTFKYTNDLIDESSPYLLQHAHNPVNWKPWNEETLALAKKENKLIIVSIGYSACHWCHVMEHESFKNDTVAVIMNENFINIKVDREERPDIDQVYMDAVQLLTGSGGWPLNVITLPDGRPVFGGTYFEKDQWLKVIQDISYLYKESPEKVVTYAEKLTAGITSSDLVTISKKPTAFNNEFITKAVENWKVQFDTINGGQIGTTKFPMPTNLNFLLQHAYQNTDEIIENHVLKTLTKIANGGIYDHVGGGFSRYTVDESWHIPHFEKMLYDNAQLVSLYSNAYALTKSDLFKERVEETLVFLERECLDETGGFYSAIDADSKNIKGELEEGAYYTWTKEELKRLLKSNFDLFTSYYDISDSGLWENNKYVLKRTSIPLETIRKIYNLNESELKNKISKINTVLLEARNQRQSPRMDNKILTSWNALNINAYVDAYRVFQNKHYLEVAKKIGYFIVNNQQRDDGGLNHVFINNKSSIDGYAEDYAASIEAYINLYQVTLDEIWLIRAKKLMDYTIKHFYDSESGMFYFTSNNAPPLITRKIETTDGVIPSSNATLASSLFKLSLYYYNDNYDKIAKYMMRNVKAHALTSPSNYGKWLNLIVNYSNPFYEVVMSGKDAHVLLNEINSYYLPNIIVAGSTVESDIPLLKNKYVPNETLIYVCTNGNCKLPQTQVSAAIKNIR